MIYPVNFEEKTGFTIIRRLLVDYCISDMGVKQVEGLGFHTDISWIEKEVTLTHLFRRMLEMEPGFPASDYFDLREELMRVQTPGTFLPVEILDLLRVSLNVILGCVDIINELPADFELLKELTGNVMINPLILKEINRIMDEKGEIKDTASPKLLNIRKELKSQKSSINRQIARSLTNAKSLGLVADNTEITIRNGRMVIPVPSAYKRKIQGFIHDESATGQTAFIEPAEVFEINNQIRELEYAENREIVNILTSFTDFLREFTYELSHAYEVLGRLDFLRAKAKLAMELGAVMPIIHDKPEAEWYDAVHPHLFLSHQKSHKPVVPLDITLSENNRILVISGPNAGGKSVCLKTVGLLQYMLQCGLLVPLRATSEMGLFKNIFINIGDQQSLEDDLSTYSSHLIDLKALLEFADNETLFLIDEFGSGTEPQSGGAIAEAVLEKLLDKRAKGVVTTHYDNLKLMARKGNGIINGAMLFDPKNMKPLYRLSVGKPGSSFAFEIAAGIGFPKNVLDEAAKKTGESKINFDRLIHEIEAERLEIAQKERQLKAADTFLEEMIEKYKKLYLDLETRRKTVLEKAKNQALQLLEKSNKIIEKTVWEIRSAQADKVKTQQARKEVADFIQDLETGKPILDEESLPRDPSVFPEEAVIEIKPERPLQKGDYVKVIGQTEAGEISEIKGGEALVTFNSMNMKVSVEQLEFVREPVKAKRPSKSYVYSSVVNELNDRLANFNLTIDIRGKRAEEALDFLHKYIDEAIMLNMHEVYIIHGKGNGVLRQIVRDYLATVPEVKSFADERIERGGSGKTIVLFK